MFLISAYLIAHCRHLPGCSVWRDLSPAHQSQRFGEEGWLGKVLGEPPHVSLGGKRTFQEGTLENAEMKPGWSHLVSPSHFPWRWYSLKRYKCGNMGCLSQSSIWERRAFIHRWAPIKSHMQASSRQVCPKPSFT